MSIANRISSECENQHLSVSVSGWGCIHMTTSHNRRCRYTWYMYEVDLLWVWSGRDAWIIIYSYSMIQVRNQDNLILPLPLRLWDQAYIRLWLNNMTTSHCSRCWIALYMYKEDLIWVWREWGAWFKRTNSKQRPTSYTLHQQHPLLVLGPRGQISGCGSILMTCSHWSRCWIALYIYRIQMTCY